MGFSDGFYYGQGKIIVNTALLLDGDVIRVRSVTTPTKVWNKTVVSGDEFLVFEVPGKDYYKISLVQDVENTPTEVANVFRTVDYGQVMLVDVLNKTSLAGIQAILNSHSENDLLNIGDEVIIKVGGIDWTMQVVGMDLYDEHEVVFASKYVFTTTQWGGNNMAYNNANCAVRNACLNFLNTMNPDDSKYLKAWTKTPFGSMSNNTRQMITITDKVQIPMVNEVIPNQESFAWTIQPKHFPYFYDATKRIKTTRDGTVTGWWRCEYAVDSSGSRWYSITTAGAGTYTIYSSNLGVVPCFHLTADA